VGREGGRDIWLIITGATVRVVIASLAALPNVREVVVAVSTAVMAVASIGSLVLSRDAGASRGVGSLRMEDEE
jgi:hypothetical protein